WHYSPACVSSNSCRTPPRPSPSDSTGKGACGRAHSLHAENVSLSADRPILPESQPCEIRFAQQTFLFRRSSAHLFSACAPWVSPVQFLSRAAKCQSFAQE